MKLSFIWEQNTSGTMSSRHTIFLALETLYGDMHSDASSVDDLQVKASKIQWHVCMPSGSQRAKYFSHFLMLASITLDRIVSCGTGKNKSLQLLIQFLRNMGNSLRSYNSVRTWLQQKVI